MSVRPAACRARLMPALFTLLVLCAALGAAMSPAARAFEQEPAPTLTVNDDCTALAFGPGGRLTYSVRHVFGDRQFDLQRDDFWLHEPGKKERRILNGQRLFPPGEIFSYVVHAIRWSPDGTKLAAEVFTTTVPDSRAKARTMPMTLLFDAEGREIIIPGLGSMIPQGVNPHWLADGATLLYLTEDKDTPRQFTVNSVRPVEGTVKHLFTEARFLAVAWQEGKDQAVAVQAPAASGGKLQLVLLELAAQHIRSLTSLEGYAGGLSLSPSGKQVALFRDPEQFELRNLASAQDPRRLKLLMGEYLWSPDERRILLKAAPARKSGALEWIRLADGAEQDVFHGLAVFGFAISPDGQRLGVLEPGKHILTVYPLASVEGTR